MADLTTGALAMAIVAAESAHEAFKQAGKSNASCKLLASSLLDTHDLLVSIKKDEGLQHSNNLASAFKKFKVDLRRVGELAEGLSEGTSATGSQSRHVKRDLQQALESLSTALAQAHLGVYQVIAHDVISGLEEVDPQSSHEQVPLSKDTRSAAAKGTSTPAGSSMALMQLSATRASPGLKFSSDRLGVRYTIDNGSSYDEDGEELKGPVGCVQANAAIPQTAAVFYYELTVVDEGPRGCIAIGFAGADHDLQKQPGLEPGSYGYDSDGNQYPDGGTEQGHIWTFAPVFTKGNVVGAGIHMGRKEIFYTRNGNVVGTASTGVCAKQLYPTISLRSSGDAVRVNFGAQPFRCQVASAELLMYLLGEDHLIEDQQHVLNTVKSLLASGAAADTADQEGWTPLHLACQQGRADVAEALLKGGASVDKATRSSGYTALHEAARTGDSKVVALLLSHGADINKASNLGFTPLMVASEQGHVAVVELLLKKGAQLEAVDYTEEERTALHHACTGGTLAVVRLLLGARANVNVRDKFGQTPIMVTLDNDDIVQLLLEAGAEPPPWS